MTSSAPTGPGRPQSAASASGVGVLISKCLRAWRIARTRVLWGGRLHSLGQRTILGRPQLVRNSRVVSVGGFVTVESGFVLADLRRGHGLSPKIVIGDGCTILYRFQCNAAERVVIGKNVLIASNVLITDSDHVVSPCGPPTTRNPALITRPVAIGDNCWIGQNAVILKGVTIGSHCIIGANTVVTRDVPDRSIVAGNPGRVIKQIPTERGSLDRSRAVAMSEFAACT